ncbi:MAG TPA: TolC family protein [Modicisalibacter sp.]|nr:TolC family protein [Modicisalibacter sp.]
MTPRVCYSSNRRPVGAQRAIARCLFALALASATANAQSTASELPYLDGVERAPITPPVSMVDPLVDNDGQLPSLPFLLSLALENDSELARQRYEMQATRQEVPMAWAGLKPQVSARASYSYQRADNIYTENPDRYPDEVYDDRISGLTDDTFWQVELTQPLFNLERWRQVTQAEEQVDAAMLQVAVAERDLALMVVEAYLNAYLASRKLGLLDSKRESLELQQRQAQRTYELGLGDRINVMEAQARLDQAVADQVQAENQLANALSDLQRLTGLLPDFTGFTLGNLEAVDIDQQWDEPEAWLARASNNVRVRLAGQQYQVAQVATEVRRASRYPELNLNLSYGDRNSSDALRSSEDYAASVELSAPIYQGGFTSASIRQGELTELAGRSAMVNELRLAQVEVRKRLRSLEGDLRQLDALARSIESSALFLEAAIKGEDLGLRDLVDVLDARAELYDLRIQFVEVICRYLNDKINLEAAVGDLDTADLVGAMSLLQRITLS